MCHETWNFLQHLLINFKLKRKKEKTLFTILSRQRPTRVFGSDVGFSVPFSIIIYYQGSFVTRKKTPDNKLIGMVTLNYFLFFKVIINILFAVNKVFFINHYRASLNVCKRS
jgi:hypothetical protein